MSTPHSMLLTVRKHGDSAAGAKWHILNSGLLNRGGAWYGCMATAAGCLAGGRCSWLLITTPSFPCLQFRYALGRRHVVRLCACSRRCNSQCSLLDLPSVLRCHHVSKAEYHRTQHVDERNNRFSPVSIVPELVLCLSGCYYDVCIMT